MLPYFDTYGAASRNVSARRPPAVSPLRRGQPTARNAALTALVTSSVTIMYAARPPRKAALLSTRPRKPGIMTTEWKSNRYLIAEPSDAILTRSHLPTRKADRRHD